jgi:hypothetical protein
LWQYGRNVLIALLVLFLLRCSIDVQVTTNQADQERALRLKEEKLIKYLPEEEKRRKLDPK